MTHTSLPVDDEVLNARAYAIKMHGTQMYGELPYVTHLDAVYREVSSSIGKDWLDAKKAAYGHDLEEDVQACTRDAVREQLGVDAEEIVYCCTGEGSNRKERQASIANKLQGKPRAILVKLCDRVVNMESCRDSGNLKLLKTYVSEIPLYESLFKTSDPALFARFVAFKGFFI